MSRKRGVTRRNMKMGKEEDKFFLDVKKFRYEKKMRSKRNGGKKG